MASSSSNTGCASCKSKGRKCTPECLFPNQQGTGAASDLLEADQQLQQHQGGGAVGGNYSNHNNMPQAVNPDPQQEQQLQEPMRLEFVPGTVIPWTNETPAMLNDIAQVVGGMKVVIQAIMDGHLVIRDPQGKEFQQLEAARQLQEYEAMFLNYKQQQHEEMMRFISEFGVHGGSDASTSQALFDQMQPPPQSQAQGRSERLFLLLISEILFSSNVQLTSFCFWVQL